MALKSATSTRLVVGPAGAGEHLRQQPTPLLDGLVHGERRWFTMQPDIFMKLRSKAEASGALEPSSAFVFFESQLEELVEDLDLGAKGLSYREGVAKAGRRRLYSPFHYIHVADVRRRGVGRAARSGPRATRQMRSTRSCGRRRARGFPIM